MAAEQKRPSLKSGRPNRNEDDRNNWVKVIIQWGEDQHVMSTSVPVEYENLLNAEANILGMMLAGAVNAALVKATLPLAREKAEELGQAEVFDAWSVRLSDEVKALVTEL